MQLIDLIQVNLRENRSLVQFENISNNHYYCNLSHLKFFFLKINLFEAAFLSDCSVNFQRIAGATGGVFTTGDVKSEAYILAYEVGEKRGYPIDFTSIDDRNLILGALHNKLVKRSDWRLKRAIRIGASDDEDDAERSAIFELPAMPSSDPLVYLVAKEEMAATEKDLLSSFSQFRAYVVVFFRFNNNRQAICNYLLIHTSTLRRRFHRAEEIVRCQASLFDKKKKITKSFKALPGKRYFKYPEISLLPQQQLLIF